MVAQAMEYLTLPLASRISKPRPGDQHGVLGVAQRNGLDPAVTERLFRIATADFLLVTAELGPVDEVVERLVGSRLAGEDEIIAGVGHHLGDGMAGEQIVAQEHAAQRREPPAVLFEPAPDGVAFAVLFLGAVWAR